jgi:YfiH family protein
MILEAANLAALDWLEHGFGTRLSGDWPPQPYVNLRQIHSDIVVNAGAEACGVLGDGDGLVTSQPDLWIGVRTADCAPVILADPVHRAAAVVHAGWRGTVGMIVAKAVERMEAQFGSRAADLVAAVGPAIGPCCYEVGPEVAEKFAPWRRDAGSHVDIPGTLRQQLMELRVKQIEVMGGCTRCATGRYHSFRRDGDASGRMISAARIKG